MDNNPVSSGNFSISFDDILSPENDDITNYLQNTENEINISDYSLAGNQNANGDFIIPPPHANNDMLFIARANPSSDNDNGGGLDQQPSDPFDQLQNCSSNDPLEFDVATNQIAPNLNSHSQSLNIPRANLANQPPPEERICLPDGLTIGKYGLTLYVDPVPSPAPNFQMNPSPNTFVSPNQMSRNPNSPSLNFGRANPVSQAPTNNKIGLPDGLTIGRYGLTLNIIEPVSSSSMQQGMTPGMQNNSMMQQAVMPGMPGMQMMSGMMQSMEQGEMPGMQMMPGMIDQGMIPGMQDQGLMAGMHQQGMIRGMQQHGGHNQHGSSCH